MTDVFGAKEETLPKPQNDSNASSDAELAHRRMEDLANKAAKRAGERMKRDEAGNDEFSNIGPV